MVFEVFIKWKIRKLQHKNRFFNQKKTMKFSFCLVSIFLMSFTSPERAISVFNTPKLKIANFAPPSDSLSLKNFRNFKAKENRTAENNKSLIKKIVSGKSMTGTATYYAKYFEGRKAANGEVFSHSKNNVASNFFKLNSWVRVTSLINGKSIIARVTDRMHPRMAARGRVVDITSEHARVLGFYGGGMSKVKIEEVKPGTEE